MENIWRFYNTYVSGIVIASSEEEAMKRALHYLKHNFNENEIIEVIVWKAENDDDYDCDMPWALAIAY